MSDLTALFEQTAAQRGTVGTDDALLSLRQLIDAARETADELAQVNARAGMLQKRIDDLERDLIPAAMDAAGVKSFTAADGTALSVSDMVSGTLNVGKDETAAEHERRRAAAFAWLNAQGHGGVIKRTLEIPLARHTPPDTVERMRRVLTREGIPFDEIEDVHHSTLGSLLRELVEQHKGVLPEPIARLFRATQFRRAKLNRPKRRK